MLYPLGVRIGQRDMSWKLTEIDTQLAVSTIAASSQTDKAAMQVASEKELVSLQA